MSEVVHRERQQIIPAASSAAADTAQSMIHVIQRAAANPEVDVDKMERLLAMHERILSRSAEEQYNAAFAAMQAELPTITKEGAITNRAGQVQSRYARFEDIHRAVQPITTAHGFAMSFRIESTQMGTPRVALKFMHRAGHHEITPYLDIPRDKTGSKNEAQAQGSSVQYGKRYVMCAFLNINTEGEDVDASDLDDDQQPQHRTAKPRVDEPQRTAGATGKATEAQVKTILRKLLEKGIADDELLAQFEVGALADLTLEQVNPALDWIRKWKPQAEPADATEASA